MFLILLTHTGSKHDSLMRTHHFNETENTQSISESDWLKSKYVMRRLRNFHFSEGHWSLSTMGPVTPEVTHVNLQGTHCVHISMNFRKKWNSFLYLHYFTTVLCTIFANFVSSFQTTPRKNVTNPTHSAIIFDSCHHDVTSIKHFDNQWGCLFSRDVAQRCMNLVGLK